MLLRKPLLLLLLLFCCAKGFSATFVVTSNADSGPGTLRDALTQAAANGTVEKDYITFNLPDLSIAGRTIIIQNQLPDVTGNIVIDGTTQPGLVLGVSNAKITITATPAATQRFTAFNVSGSVNPNDGIEFYGLYITNTNNEFTGFGNAILTNADCKLIVGAPGKGNVICNILTAIGGYLDNCIVQSNFFGVMPDGETLLRDGSAIATNRSYNSLLIGGDTQNEGNLFASSDRGNCLEFDQVYASIYLPITIENNYFGTDYKGTTLIDSFAGFPYIYSNGGQSPFTIKNNVFAAVCTAIDFFNQVKATITGNYFGTDKTQTYKLGNSGLAISENSFVNLTIGGDNDADQNVFTGYGNPIFSLNYSNTDIIKNKFYCNDACFTTDAPRGNYIRIINLVDNEISGDAPAGATVQLYYTDATAQCSNCNPTTWFASVTAGPDGKWDYKGDTKNNIMVSSTIAGNTVGFQPYSVGKDEVTITNIDCHHPVGSIEINEKRSGRFQFSWTDSNGSQIGSDQKVNIAKAGVYYLHISEGGICPTALGQFEVDDNTTHVYGSNTKLRCGNKTAVVFPTVITAIGVGVTDYYWKDSNGNVISSEQSPSLPIGTYTFYVKDTNGCLTDPVTIQVLPQDPLPVLDDSKAIKTDADCGENNGSITNLVIQNIPTGGYAGWFDNGGNFKSYGPDLTNAAPGTYHYAITYDYSCAPLVSRDFIIGIKNGITMDETNAQSHQASCGNGNGSVTGIQVTGATTYQWTDGNNKIVGNQPELTNVVAGTYTLTASNATGCSKTSKTYTVIEKPATVYPAYNYSIVNTCPHYPTGSISITADNLVTAYRWVNSAGMPYGNTPAIGNLPADTYTLYLTDANGCESLYNTFKVAAVTQLAIMAGSETITNDQCGNSKGGITGVEISGGTEPYVYRWTNASGTLIATTADLGNVQAGYYKLNVHDASNCGDASASYTVANDANIIPTPSVSNVQVCSSGSAIVSVNNASATCIYNLYGSESSTTPVDQQTGGKFKVDVSGNTSFYITQINGTCESSKAKVDVTVGMSVLNIANTFTPNGDGINDYWKISNIENYPQAVVQIFTRSGQKIFESKGYQVPFDGTYKGQNLPAGVYYFIIDMHSNCSLLSGSLTILR